MRNAHYYKLMGRPEVALKELEQAHLADPGNLKIVDTLAQSYQEIGDFQRAQELYQEALAHSGANQAINNNLCFSYYFQGNLAKAEACFKEALVRDPENAAARNNLGLVWCREGKTAEAQRLWEQAEGGKAAQNHLNQALAFLGMSTPAHYAKSPEPKAESRLQLARSTEPAAPANLASAAKIRAAEMPIPEKQTRVAAPAMHPKAAVKEVAKRVEPKPEVKPQLLATPKPAAPVVLAAAPKPEPAKALAPVQAARPLPLAALPAKTALTEAKKPAEPRPELRPQPAKSPKPSAPVILAAAARPPVATPAPAMQPKPVVKAAAKPVVSSAPLTAAERAGAGIELRNGTRTKFLAHHARSLLRREGFKVTQIGNYIDFGAVTTTIYYRPGAERVARALGSEFFPGAGIEPSSSLNKQSTIKVVLGRDFVDQPRLAARAAGSKTVAPPPAGEAKPLEVGTQVMPAASKEPPAPVTLAAPIQSGADRPKIHPSAQVVS
ncbi:MAG TPA: tetratricopeptide repeat protein, partial [Desulfobaccales bacterium]